MAEKWFSLMGRKAAGTTRAAAERTGSLVSAAKIGKQMKKENREIDRLLRQLGEQVERKAAGGTVTLAEEERQILAEIEERRKTVSGLREKLAEVKGMKVCPGCKEMIQAKVAFCPRCGAPVSISDGKKES